MAFAFVYVNGRVGFAEACPTVALPFVMSTLTVGQLHDAITPLCRLSYDGNTWLMPGVPEAVTEPDKLKAVAAFKRRIEPALIRAEQEAA